MKEYIVSNTERAVEFVKYENTIEQVRVFLQDRLGRLAINSAIFFGSSTMGEGYFKDGVSDIDVCAFSDIMKPANYDDIVLEVQNSLSVETSDKAPTLLRDHTADRVEFFMEFPDIKIDMNIMSPGLPNTDEMHTTAAHDSLDLLYGNFYKYGVPFIGDIPLRNEIDEKFYPFYSDSLRTKRLDILTKRIKESNERVYSDIEQSISVFDDVYKSRNYFLKWLFIYHRAYPISLTKHLDRQLTDFLGMNREEVEALQFSGSGDIIELTKNYLDLTRQYMDQFDRERDVNEF